MNEWGVRTVTHWVACAESHLRTRPTCSGLRARAASPFTGVSRARCATLQHRHACGELASRRAHSGSPCLER